MISFRWTWIYFQGRETEVGSFHGSWLHNPNSSVSGRSNLLQTRHIHMVDIDWCNTKFPGKMVRVPGSNMCTWIASDMKMRWLLSLRPAIVLFYWVSTTRMPVVYIVAEQCNSLHHIWGERWARYAARCAPTLWCAFAVPFRGSWMDKSCKNCGEYLLVGCSVRFLIHRPYI